MANPSSATAQRHPAVTRGRAILIAALCVLLGAGLSSCGWLGKKGDPTTELPVFCLTKPKAGRCAATATGYFYDYRDNRCKPIRYGPSCGGQTPFDSLRKCVKFCGAQP